MRKFLHQIDCNVYIILYWVSPIGPFTQISFLYIIFCSLLIGISFRPISIVNMACSSTTYSTYQTWQAVACKIPPPCSLALNVMPIFVSKQSIVVRCKIAIGVYRYSISSIYIDEAAYRYAIVFIRFNQLCMWHRQNSALCQHH